MKYCYECGTLLEQRELEGEGLVPWCPQCEAYRFPIFSTAIITAVFNPVRDKVLLIQQYGRQAYILLAGYVSKGENAEETLAREVMEEVGLRITGHRYIQSAYFERSNTLMLNYLCVADSEELHPTSEVDQARWFTFEEARNQILKGSLAERFLTHILDQMEQGLL